MNAETLNDLLRGRTILSVEEGTTPGWIVINLSIAADDALLSVETKVTRVMMTAFVGGADYQCEDDHYHATVALHFLSSNGWGEGMMIRDDRDPNMPTSWGWKHTVGTCGKSHCPSCEKPETEIN